MRATQYILVSVLLFSLFSSCKDRFFNNPLDPDKEERDYEIVATIPISGLTVVDLTFSGDSMWVVDSLGRIISLNHNSGSTIRELDYSTNAGIVGICYDGSNLWLNKEYVPEMVQINIINGEILRILNLTEGRYGVMDYHESTIYLAEKLSNSVLKIDSETGEILASINNPSFSMNGLCFDGQHLWILDAANLKIYRLQPDGSVENVYQTPDKNPTGLTFSQGFIWLGDKSGKIYKLRF